jgi:hypothetical protein
MRAKTESHYISSIQLIVYFVRIDVRTVRIYSLSLILVRFFKEPVFFVTFYAGDILSLFLLSHNIL